jgi:predicted transcriptional regulator
MGVTAAYAWVPPAQVKPGVDLSMIMRKDMRMTIRTREHRAPARHRNEPTQRVPTNLSLPRDLVAELDEIAGPRNRSAFAEAAIRRAIKREQLRTSIERTAGSLKTEDYPHWRTSDDVVRWVRELRAEETDSGPVTG